MKILSVSEISEIIDLVLYRTNFIVAKYSPKGSKKEILTGSDYQTSFEYDRGKTKFYPLKHTLVDEEGEYILIYKFGCGITSQNHYDFDGGWEDEYDDTSNILEIKKKVGKSFKSIYKNTRL